MFPVELLLFVLLQLLLFLVLFGRLDAEVLQPLILRQLIVVNLHPLGLALVFSLLSGIIGSFLSSVMIGIDTEDLLK